MQLQQIKRAEVDLSSLSDVEINVSQSIHDIVFLSPFEISDLELIDWAKRILKIHPNVDPLDIQAVVDDFTTGDLPYDNKLAIRNIFIGLKAKFGSKYKKNNHVI